MKAIIGLAFLALVLYGIKEGSNDFTEAAEGKSASQFDLIRDNVQQMIA